MKDNMSVHMPAQFLWLEISLKYDFLSSKWEFVMICAQNLLKYNLTYIHNLDNNSFKKIPLKHTLKSTYVMMWCHCIIHVDDNYLYFKNNCIWY